MFYLLKKAFTPEKMSFSKSFHSYTVSSEQNLLFLFSPTIIASGLNFDLTRA